MASGAFLTSAFVEAPQPTVFEVTAQASLTSSLQPALDHFLKVVSAWNPGHLGCLHQLRDEIHLLLNSALQLHYLKVYSSSFTENFYGLERASDNPSQKLPLMPSFVFLVIGPYIRRKLEGLFSRSREDDADGLQCRSPFFTKIRNIYIKMFPLVFFFTKAATLGFLLSFTLKKTKYHSLSAYLAGISLVYVDPDTLREMEARNEAWMQNSSGWKLALASSVAQMAKVVTFSLEVGSFFLQFMDWWYNQERDNGDLRTETIPKPPEPVKGLAKVGSNCPVCHKKRKGETVLSSSGLVFCYVCIVKYLRRHGKCPVTSLPSKEAQLIRLFPPE